MWYLERSVILIRRKTNEGLNRLYSFVVPGEKLERDANWKMRKGWRAIQNSDHFITSSVQLQLNLLRSTSKNVYNSI